MTDPLHALAREVGTEPPPSFATLEPSEIEALTAALTAARKHQNEALEQAIENGLGFIPRLLRGPIRKALFG